MQLLNASRNTLLAQKAVKADTFFRRLKGLLGTDSLPEGAGLIIYPCSSVHTFGMKYAIDVLFMSKNNEIVKIVDAMPPGKVASAAKTKYVIELPAGTAAKTLCQPGDVIEMITLNRV